MEEYIESNRNAWDQVAPIHARKNFAGLVEHFSQPGYNCLDEIIAPVLQKIGLSGKHVVQFCCNNGRELLSIKNMGAASITGFDISGEFIRQAQELARAASLEAHFVASDIYNIPAAFDRQFDLLYISIGVLGWMPDLERFFQVASRLLKPTSWMVIYEMHPILDMFDSSDTNDPPALRESYFRKEPFRETDGLDYYEFNTYEASPTYWFPHTMSNIIQACLNNDFTVRRFQEFGHDLSNVYARFESLQVKPPLSFLLACQK